MGRRGRMLGATAACALVAASCGGGKSAHRGPARRLTGSTTARSDGAGSTTTTTPRHAAKTPARRGTTTTAAAKPQPKTLLEALLADGRNADIKVVYDTPSGQVTLIRRHGDSVYADGSGVRFTLGSLSYDCTGTGDGATCTKIRGDATQSDVDAYTGLVADALTHANSIATATVSLLGRTAECVTITGLPAGHAGRIVTACIDDESGVLVRFTTYGPPTPGAKLYAVAIGAPSAADFQLPVPPT